MNSDDIKNQVLKRTNPNAEQKKNLEYTICNLKKDVKKEIEKRKLPVAIELVGSTAKDTYLANNLDIDLFLLFPTKISREDLEKTSLSIGRSILKDNEECYAEHPYIRGVYNNYKTEIVPCYKIEFASQKLSAVDRTPLHTKYIKKHLKELQKNEVRLFKQFLKGIGCYGAEAEVEGFSGYLCELLILKYESFQNLIQNAQTWKCRKKIFLSKGKYADFDTPLTFIDPVDSDRNVASALVKNNFDLFITACKEYIKHPRITFFFPNDIQSWSLNKIKKEIQKREDNFIGIKISKPNIISENLYPQIRKATRSIKDLCERHDFVIADEKFFVDIKNNTIYIIFKTKKELLSKSYVHLGPPTKLKKNADNFLKKWKNDPRLIKKPYEKEGRLYVELKREYIDMTNLLKDQLKNLSLGRHITKMIKKEYSVLESNDLVIENLSTFWTEYLDNKKSWER